MNYRSFVVAGTAAAAALAAGCISTTGVNATRPFSYIDVRELRTGAGSSFGTYASAVFIKDRVTGVVPSYALNESCTSPQPISADDGSITGISSTNLDPGSVSMTVKGTVDTTTRSAVLQPDGLASGIVQYTNSDTPISLTPGTDSVRFDIAGQAGGFPAFSIKTGTVPHFVAQPVDDSITGQGIRVQWTPLDATSPTRMQISLQYASDTSHTPNVEMRCIAYDDGDFTIPRQYLTGWEDAGVDSAHTPHRVVLSRFNTIGVNVADGVAVIVARIDTTIVK